MPDRFVYFDLGNVLVNFDHRIATRKLARLANVSEDRVSSVLFDSGLQNRYETGLVTCQEFAQEINDTLNTAIPQTEVLEAVSDIFCPNPNIIPALQAVHEAGLPIGILSNTCAAHWKWIERQAWETVTNWFDVYILSYEVRSMKPDSNIYIESERRANVPAEKIFFTDDRLENVAAAASRGWNTHHFRGAERLLPELHRWLKRA